MFAVALGAIAAALFAGFLYLRRERLGAAGVGMAALRTVALAVLVLLLVNPTRTQRVTGGAPTVLLDASLSMDAAGGKWREALDTAMALTRDGGVLWRFGSTVASFDTLPPADGTSLLRDALTAARAREGATIVITDGEIEDASGLTPVLAPGTQFLRLPRDTLADAALLAADLPERVQRDDSVRATVTVGTFGPLTADSAELEILVNNRRLLITAIDLPPSPGSARRSVSFPARLLGPGAHVIRLRLLVEGDLETRNNERWRVVDVSAQPAVVVLVDPADWEGRFLVQELTDIARTTVRGFARTARSAWLDMRTLRRVPEADVRAAAGAAGLLVIRGRPTLPTGTGRRPTWRWPAGSDTRAAVFQGDWYPTADTPVSPLAGRLASVEWDSLPPLSGIVPLSPGGSEWVALTARQGRRGAERPVLVGRDSAGRRELTTAGEGLWRWRFRGGAPREAYRAVLAAGVDWLLADDGGGGRAPLVAGPVVERGNPVVFRWRGDSIPDSVVVSITGADSTRDWALRFDAAGAAMLSLEPGEYRWASPDVGARGLTVVEPYSAEYSPRPVMDMPGVASEAYTLLERYPREWWWMFLVVVLAFAGEWAWRWRRGLP